MSASSSWNTGAPQASDDHQRSSSSKQDSNLTTGGRSGNLYPIGAKKTPARVFPTAAKNAAKKKPLRRGSVHQDTSWSKKLSKAPGSREASGTSADDSAEGGAATSVAAPAPETATVTCYIMVDMSAKQFQDLSEAGGTSAPCRFSCEGLGRIQFQTNDGEEAALVMLNGHDNMKISLGSDDAEVSHCDAPEPPSSLQAEFKAGASVRIYGLINAKHFNGVRATCESFDDISGAWSVKLTTGETKKLMPDNLQLVVPSELRARALHRAHKGAYRSRRNAAKLYQSHGARHASAAEVRRSYQKTSAASRPQEISVTRDSEVSLAASLDSERERHGFLASG